MIFEIRDVDKKFDPLIISFLKGETSSLIGAIVTIKKDGPPRTAIGARLFKHVSEVCEKNGIKLDELIIPKTVINRILFDSITEVFGSANSDKKIVRVTYINGFEEYAAAMHEIGHILNPVETLDKDTAKTECIKFIEDSIKNNPISMLLRALNPNDLLKEWFQRKFILVNEIAAWNWAKEYAIVWNEEMEKFSKKCVQTYEKDFYNILG